jgi:hypothetical protein
MHRNKGKQRKTGWKTQVSSSFNHVASPLQNTPCPADTPASPSLLHSPVPVPEQQTRSPSRQSVCRALGRGELREWERWNGRDWKRRWRGRLRVVVCDEGGGLAASRSGRAKSRRDNEAERRREREVEPAETRSVSVLLSDAGGRVSRCEFAHALLLQREKRTNEEERTEKQEKKREEKKVSIPASTLPFPPSLHVPSLYYPY